MTMRKTFRANPPKAAAPAPPRDDKRTFDMRPKPVADRRDEPRYRPPQYAEPLPDPMDVVVDQERDEGRSR